MRVPTEKRIEISRGYRHIIPGAEIFDTGVQKVNNVLPDTNGNVDTTRGFLLWFLSGATPTGTGADQEVHLIPYDPDTGGSMTFQIDRVVFRLETAGTSTSTIKLERSAGLGAFSATALPSLSLASGEYQVTNSTYGVTDLVSGNLLRTNIVAIGTGAQKWSLHVMLSEV